MTAVSLVAQAGTLALAVRLFNIFPLFSCEANIVVIPVSFAVLALAFLLIVFSGVTPVASFFAMLLGKLSGFTLGFTGMISSIDHGVIDNIGLTTAGAVLLTTAHCTSFRHPAANMEDYSETLPGSCLTLPFMRYPEKPEREQAGET